MVLLREFLSKHIKVIKAVEIVTWVVFVLLLLVGLIIPDDPKSTGWKVLMCALLIDVILNAIINSCYITLQYTSKYVPFVLIIILIALITLFLCASFEVSWGSKYFVMGWIIVVVLMNLPKKKKL